MAQNEKDLAEALAKIILKDEVEYFLLNACRDQLGRELTARETEIVRAIASNVGYSYTGSFMLALTAMRLK